MKAGVQLLTTRQWSVTIVTAETSSTQQESSGPPHTGDRLSRKPGGPADELRMDRGAGAAVFRLLPGHRDPPQFGVPDVCHVARVRAVSAAAVPRGDRFTED